MTHFTKTLIATATLAMATAPAIAQVAAPDTSPTCAPIAATVYFTADQAELSTAASAALEAQTELADGCIISTIEATTIATDGNSNLAEARSHAVLEALSSMGIATADTITEIGKAPEGRLIATARQVNLTLTTLPTYNDS